MARPGPFTHNLSRSQACKGKRKWSACTPLHSWEVRAKLFNPLFWNYILAPRKEWIVYHRCEKDSQKSWEWIRAIAELWIRSANAKVVTASIPASSDSVESEERKMMYSWRKKNTRIKSPQLKLKFSVNFKHSVHRYFRRLNFFSPIHTVRKKKRKLSCSLGKSRQEKKKS